MTYLNFKEVANISILNSSIFEIANSDVLWKKICQSYDPSLNENHVKKLMNFNDPFPMWKNYFVKKKEIFRGKDIYVVENFIERFPRKFRGIYVTSAVDDSILNVLKNTFDDILKFQKYI
jgi:hypothetical protein